MRDHVHTGPISVLFAGLSAILIINLARYGSAWLIDHGYERVGRATGALVHFG